MVTVDSALGDGAGRPGPRPPGLPAPVQEDDRPIGGVAAAVGGDADSAGALDTERFGTAHRASFAVSDTNWSSSVDNSVGRRADGAKPSVPNSANTEMDT